MKFPLSKVLQILIQTGIYHAVVWPVEATLFNYLTGFTVICILFLVKLLHFIYSSYNIKIIGKEEFANTNPKMITGTTIFA